MRDIRSADGNDRTDLVPLGSEQHKQLFCRMLLDTHDPYDPSLIAWPDLPPEPLARLRSLPFWDIAVGTEGDAAIRMQALADTSDDPLIAEAIALNAFEERRHKEVLHRMLSHYEIETGPEQPYVRPEDARWAFLRTGYGECFDSFFAFGLFALAGRTGFFPAPLVAVFEPVMQEEARHNLFFVNWVAYMRRCLPAARKLPFSVECFAALARQVWARAGMAESVDGDNFTRTGADAAGVSLDPRSFLETCLAEHDRRFAGYDPSLLRPQLMPNLSRALCWILPRGKAPATKA
jgi:hypothetical protein